MSYIGLLPTDYYPTTIATVGDQIVVTNTRGIDARGPEPLLQQGPGHHARGGSRHAQHHRLADPLHPAERQGDRQYTDTVFAQNGWGTNDDVRQARVPAPAFTTTLSSFGAQSVARITGSFSPASVTVVRTVSGKVAGVIDHHQVERIVGDVRHLDEDQPARVQQPAQVSKQIDGLGNVLQDVLQGDDVESVFDLLGRARVEPLDAGIASTVARCRSSRSARPASSREPAR